MSDSFERALKEAREIIKNREFAINEGRLEYFEEIIERLYLFFAKHNMEGFEVKQYKVGTALWGLFYFKELALENEDINSLLELTSGITGLGFSVVSNYVVVSISVADILEY